MPSSLTEEKLRERLQAGDIILTGYPKAPTGLSPKAIYQRASVSLQGQYTHATIYVGDGEIVESHIQGGVRKLPLAETLAGKPFLVVRPKLPQKIRDSAAAFADSKVGKASYDPVAALAAGARLFLPETVGSALVGAVVSKPSPQSATSFQCAALVSASYEAAGAPQKSRPSWRVLSPVELSLGGRRVREGKLLASKS